MRYLFLASVICFLISSPADAFECKVCHSKNPAMVKMHTELRGQGCFGCHKMGDRLMGKGKPKDRESQLKRRQTEELCLPCHRQTVEQQKKD